MYKKWDSIEDRFWSKVEIREPEKCWLWTGSTKPNGYAQFMFKVNGNWRPIYSHRFAYELVFGPIPEGLHLDHLCSVRLCVNPHHLEAVSQAENNERMGLERNDLGQYVGRNG